MSSKWDKRFIDLARLVASWSKDPSTQVGAVIVDTMNRIVSVGYNGFPVGTNDSEEMLSDREIKLMRTIHGEENAILFAQRSLTGCRIYVTGHPCSNCTAKIIQVGITEICYADTMNHRWNDSMDSARALAIEAGVLLRRLAP
jgi:dCMP deaminase